VRDVQGGERGVLGRLDHAGVAGGHGGADAPAAEQEREVPRHNETTRPLGVPHHRGLVASDRDGGVEGEALCEVAKVANCVDEVLDVILGLRRDLAAVQRLDLSDDEFVLLDRVGEAREEYASFVGGQPRPVGLVECLLRRRDSALYIVRLHIGHGGQFFAGTGVVGVEGVAVGGEHLPTANHGSVNFLGEKRLHFG